MLLLAVLRLAAFVALVGLAALVCFALLVAFLLLLLALLLISLLLLPLVRLVTGLLLILLLHRLLLFGVVLLRLVLLLAALLLLAVLEDLVKGVAGVVLRDRPLLLGAFSLRLLVDRLVLCRVGRRLVVPLGAGLRLAGLLLLARLPLAILLLFLLRSLLGGSYIDDSWIAVLAALALVVAYAFSRRLLVTVLVAALVLGAASLGMTPRVASSHTGDDALLAKTDLVRIPRLSIVPLTAAQFARLLERGGMNLKP